MKHTIWASMLILLSSCLFFGRVEGEASTSGPSVEDFIRMKYLPIQMPVSVSPDGKQVAYTVQDGARIGTVTDPGSMDERPGSGRLSRGCEVWLADIQGGAPLRISDSSSSSWGPVWSPNGHMVAFFSDNGGRTRPWVWDKKTGQAKPIGEIRPQIVEESDVPLWAADNKSVFFRASSDRTVEITKLRTLPLGRIEAPPLVLHSPESSENLIQASAEQGATALGRANTFAGDLVQLQIGTGEVRRITQGRQIYAYSPSPGGARIAYTTGVGYKDGDSDWTLFDVVVKDLVSGHETIAAHSALLDNSGSAFGWSPDGSELVYGTLTPGDGTRYWLWTGEPETAKEIGHAPKLSYPESPVWNGKGDQIYALSGDFVYVFGLKGQAPISLHVADPLKFTALLASQRERRVWSDSADGDTIYVSEQNTDTLELELHRIRLSNGSDETLLKRAASLALLPMEVMDTAPDGNALVFPMESPGTSPDLWTVDRGFTALRQLTHLNTAFASFTFPERRVVRWTDFEGHDLRGTLLLPSGYSAGRRYPMIVYIYGGERESRWANQFAATTGGSVENMQMFATHGYAVFVPDTVMGTETPMLDLFTSLAPGIEKVIDLGIADGKAIGIMGHSYGGYSVYSLLVQTHRFRAGVALSGSGNLLTDYAEMDATGFSTGIAWTETSQGRMVDTPWKVRSKYIENSPFFYLDRVQTPILIAHGDSDWHPAYEDREMFVGLRRLGKTAEYAEYRGEGHRISAWRYADQVDLANRILAWFDKYLGFSPQTESPKAESARRNTAGK